MKLVDSMMNYEIRWCVHNTSTVVVVFKTVGHIRQIGIVQ